MVFSASTKPQRGGRHVVIGASWRRSTSATWACATVMLTLDCRQRLETDPVSTEPPVATGSTFGRR